MENNQKEVYDRIIQSLRILDANCDGATSRDGSGFNGYDTVPGKDLSAKSEVMTLSHGELEKAVKMIQKYNNTQLAGLAPSIEEFETAYPAEEEVKRVQKAVNVSVEGSEFVVTFPYNKALVEAIKTLKARRWDGKVWRVPTYLAEELQSILGLDEMPEFKPAEAPKKEAKVVGSVIHISFPFDRAIVDAVKGIDQRKWNGSEKRWEVPMALSVQVLTVAQNFSFDYIDPKIKEASIRQLDMLELATKTESDFHIDGLLGTPYGYQNAGVEFLEAANGRAIIADEMGLGKTIQAIAYLQLHPELRPAIIVVPASLKTNWSREIGRWMSTDDKVQILSGRKSDGEIEGSILIINYDIISYWMDTLVELSPAVMIADEAHYCKNYKSKRSEAVKKLSEKIDNIILLTGTPVTNRPRELFPLLNMVDPMRWKSFMHYAKRYCGAVRGQFGWDFSGATNLEELHEKIKPNLIRRQKKDVLKELPAKRRATVLLNGDEIDLSEYRREEKAARDAEGGANVLASIEAMKQAAVKAKLPSAIQWIEDFLETDEKLIVFAWHNFVIDALMEHFGDKAVQLTGSTKMPDRQMAVDRFQEDDSVRLFVGNIKAAGVGLTLTAASNVAFLELDWVPGNHDQAEDRAHRIGQDESVTCYYLLIPETIEEDIFGLLESKRKVVDTVHDGSPRDLNFSIFDNLVEKFFEFDK